MDPNQQPHIPQTPRAPAPRPRSPPPPGWVDPNFRRWRVENGLARIVEGPESSRPKGDGIFEYAGHVGPYQPTSETIRTRTVRRVPRQGSQQVVPQDAVQPQIVQQMQRTYSAPVVAPGQQNQHQQPLPSPPAVQQTQYVQHTPIPSQLAPVQQPLYQQQHQQQILAQRAPLERHHSTSRITHTMQDTSSQPTTYDMQQSTTHTNTQPHIVSPMQTTTFTAPAEMRSSSSTTRTISYSAVQAPALGQVVDTRQSSQQSSAQAYGQRQIASSMQAPTIMAPAQIQSSSSNMRATSYGAVQTPPLAQTASMQQSTQQYSTPPHVQPCSATPVQSPTFTAPAVMRPSPSSAQMTLSRAVQTPPDRQVVPPQLFTQHSSGQAHVRPPVVGSMQSSTYTESVQTQASSLSTRTTSHGGVQTAHVPQAISVQQGVQQGHYATTQAQTQQRSHGSNGQQMQYAARQAQALPPPAHTTQQSQIRPLVQSHYSATSDVIGTSKSIHIAGTSTSGGINHVQRKAPATSAFAQGAGVCVGMNKKTNSLTHGQMHAVEQANAILQQMGLAPAIRMASAGFAMQGQGGINIFISPHLAERDWRHCHTVPFRRRPQFTGSTTIAGYNTANWGGGARQVAVRKGPKRLAEYDDEVSDHLAQAGKGVCPMNWRWYPVRQGYFCGGGNHLISHIEAESTMAGQRPQGPYVQLVNLEPEAPSRMVTPPPSPGDGNWILVGPGLRDAQRRREYHPLPKNCKGEWYDGVGYSKARHPMWHLKHE